MRMPMWVLRLMHRSHLSRPRLRGGRLHGWFGDRLLAKELWRPTREGIARAWLIGFPVTMVPFLPGQSIVAVVAVLFLRGNLLLAIALQFLSNPATLPLHFSSSYVVGRMVLGDNPVETWRHVTAHPKVLYSRQAWGSLYLGAGVIGVVGGVLGYGLIHMHWRPLTRRPPRDRGGPPAPGVIDAPLTPAGTERAPE